MMDKSHQIPQIGDYMVTQAARPAKDSSQDQLEVRGLISRIKGLCLSHGPTLSGGSRYCSQDRHGGLQLSHPVRNGSGRTGYSHGHCEFACPRSSSLLSNHVVSDF
ncbi:hypothetical protein HPP92_028917 [Vanilla planifolia]|uniref:Uncharacterized protein n=1 Tax=Vanilla planifolia TaxID=51239 RepID=A0A835P6R1_VANPL|nr:hypothetical protein HPP92_028917 [Vanilla planifolia]KAG0446282.1 hypothetical protein HPP92_028907 [Vanilla planifolia]